MSRQKTRLGEHWSPRQTLRRHETTWNSTRFEAIATRLEAMAQRLEAIAHRLEAIGGGESYGEEAALGPVWQQSPRRESQHIMVEGRGGERQQRPPIQPQHRQHTTTQALQQQQKRQQPAAEAAADARLTNTDGFRTNNEQSQLGSQK